MLLRGMRCDAVTVGAEAPPGAATAHDVHTIGYASSIAGYPRTVHWGHHGTPPPARPSAPVKNANGRSRYSRGTWAVNGLQLTAGWMAAVVQELTKEQFRGAEFDRPRHP